MSAMRVVSLIIALLLTAGMALAKDPAAIYKSKCAGCHGVKGEGKTGPQLGGTSLSEDDIVNILMKGGQPKPPHVKAFHGANEANAKAIAAYVKTLK